MKNEFRTLWLVHDFALALSTSNAHRQPEVYKLAFRSVRSSCVYAKRSTISFSLLSNEYLLITRGEFQSEFRGITVAHTLAQLYLPLLCQLALQHYLSALEWLVGRSVGCRAARPAPDEGAVRLCGECECRRTRHCSERAEVGHGR